MPLPAGRVDDLICNTLGAVLGWLIGWAVSRWVPFREPPPREDLAAPTVRRRLLAAGLDLTVAVVVTLVIDVVLSFVVVSRGGDVASWDTAFTAVTWVVGAALLLGLPLLRRDRATAGQTTVLLALVGGRRGVAAEDALTSDGALTGDGALAAAPRWSVAVRFLVRWVPILAFGLTAALVVLVVDLVTVAVRRDRRSLTAVLAGTRTVTRDRLESDDPGIGPVGQDPVAVGPSSGPSAA